MTRFPILDEDIEMKKRPILFVMSAVLLACSVQAEVVLKIPQDVDLLLVNMKKPQGSLLEKKELVLPDGPNQIVFQYRPSFDEGDMVKKAYSDTIIAKFDAYNTTVNFDLPKYRNLKQAEKEIGSLVWRLLDGTSKPLTVYEDKLNYSGVQIGRNFIQEAADYNQQGGVAALQSVSATALTAKPIVEPKTTVKLSDEISETIGQLQAWYLKASPQERKAFKKWMVDQE
ncbi:DUF2057 domain-containing protein [Vibrio cholerae]|nr:DUF2057 domain-containing protein [Vibrio cholerae]